MTYSLGNPRVTRSRDGYIAGVCEGLGNHFGVNSNLIRVGWLAAVLFFGTGILLYGLLWWLMPREDNVPLEAAVWPSRRDGRHQAPWARTVADRKLLGVCGGLAQRWQVDPLWVRLGTLALFTVSGGLVVVAYVIAAVAMPAPVPALHSRPHPVEL